MHVPVHDRHALDPMSPLEVAGRDADRVEEAEPHRLPGRRMVPGWAAERVGVRELTGGHPVDAFEETAHGHGGGLPGPGPRPRFRSDSHNVGTSSGIPEILEKRRGMHEQQLIVAGLAGGDAFDAPEHASALDHLPRAGQPRRALGVRHVEPARHAFVHDHRAVVVAQAALVVADARGHDGGSDLVWDLIPALAVSDAGPESPALRLGLRLDSLPEPVDAVEHELPIGLVEADRAETLAQPLEVELGGAPEPPVLRGQRGDHIAVDRLAVSIPDVMADEQRKRVAHVLARELDHLELGQEELGEGDRPLVDVDPGCARSC